MSMKIKRNLRVCIVEAGKTSKVIPEYFEMWVLEKYVQTNGWDCSGSAFSNEETCVIWFDEDSKNRKELHNFIPESGIKHEVLEIARKKENWIDLNYSVILETVIK